ncbi:hypothetical protein D3C75_1312570 [compost metagenome]
MGVAAFFELQEGGLLQCGQVTVLAIQLLPQLRRVGTTTCSVQALVKHQPGLRILLGSALAHLLAGKVRVMPG